MEALKVMAGKGLLVRAKVRDRSPGFRVKAEQRGLKALVEQKFQLSP